MKKLFSLLLSFLLSTAAFAQATPTTVPTTPAPQMSMARHGPMNFMGKWTLGFYNGNRVNSSGTAISLPYSEESITITSGQINPDGSMNFSGVVDGEDGSSVSIYYNPYVNKQYAQVFMYVPVMEFGLSDQNTSTECRVFLAPKGNDFLHGTMSAFQQSTDRNGNWVTKSLFSGQVDIHRPWPVTPNGAKG